MVNISEYLDVSLEGNGLQKIILNRPAKKNALDGNMLNSITSILRASSEDPAIRIIVFSGAGDYFTSGNDLNNFTKFIEESERVQDSNMDDIIQKAKIMIQEFVAAFINCPKFLVAVVNGPAVGIGVTILAHFDLVFASDLATFHCPFTKLALCPEGCSSLLFPLLMGLSKSTQILNLGKKISAQEAFTLNLVTEVVNHDVMHQCWGRIRSICNEYPNTLLKTKALLRKRLLPVLNKVNEEECDMLAEQWSSEEFMDSVMGLFMKKSKL